MRFQKGNIPWNKGLTKETDEKVRGMSREKMGHSAWNKGLTKETDARVAKGVKTRKSNYKPKPKHQITCFNCGKRVLTYNKMYCSKKCRYEKSTAWNKGLTKKTDERVRKLADAISKTLKGRSFSKKHRQQLAIVRNRKIKENPQEWLRIRRMPKHCISKLNRKLYSILDKLGIKYEKEYMVDIYFPDAALPHLKLDIEADGKYWHSLPWRIEFDKERDEKLKSLGWRVLRLKEGENWIKKIKAHIV